MAKFRDRPGFSVSGRGMRSGMDQTRRPFGLPASSYYVLAATVAITFFLLVWNIFDTGEPDSSLLTAGLSASILLAGAVILRETILRRSQNRYLRQQRVLGARLHNVNPSAADARNPHKLTLEKNAAILGEIRQKSDAAKVLNKFSAGHREVYELCGEYLARNEKEMKSIGPGSPRLAPLLKGRSAVAEYHRYHLLQWAEIESRSLTNEAKNRASVSDKIESVQNALSVIDSALHAYPAESSLLGSRELLLDFAVSIKISHTVEEAERSAFKGDYAQAKSLYRDALFYLGRDNVQSESREQAARRINAEIEKINSIAN